jgi:hypothetical protein
MKRVSRLGWLAAAVWLAWLGLVGTMFGMLKLQVWHPHFLPVTALLVALLVSGLTLLVAGTWRVVRGPKRLHALGCLLAGLPPLGFLAGHLMYGFGTAYGRQIDLILPLRVLVPFGESLLDLVARFQYPVRTEGERVVMISKPVESAREQVAAMDRHIRALEARLGRTGTRRIHWVRGPILGLQGRALLGICMGSLPGAEWNQPDEEGLTTLDRHEVAHVVLSQFCTTDMEPPAILMEGWAELASVADMKAYRLRALAEREAGRTLPLAELIGPAWYVRHDSPAYVHGAPLVDYIVRKSGPERFVELYATSRLASFAADCQRILGVSIDDLDQACWGDLDKQCGPGGYHELWLRSLPLGPSVNSGRWNQFVSDYLAAAGRLLAPYKNVKLVAERAHSAKDAKGQTSEFRWRYQLLRSGPHRMFKESSKDREEIYLAHPEQSFRAERKTGADAWEIHEDPSVKPGQAYRRIVREIDLMEPVIGGTVPLISLADLATSLANPLSLRVTRLDRFTENSRPFIRLELEECPPGHPMYRKLNLRIAAEDYTVVQDESVSREGNHWSSDAAFQSGDGVPLLRSARSQGTWDDGTSATSVLTLLDRRFETVADDEFTSERLLGNAPVHLVARQPEPVEVSPLLTWYPLPLALSAISLVSGACLLLWTGRE